MVYFHDLNSPGYSKWWGVPTVSWLVLAALLCPTIRIGDRAVDAVVKGLEMTTTKLQLENVHYTLIGLSNALKCATVFLCLTAPYIATGLRTPQYTGRTPAIEPLQYTAAGI